MVLNIYKYRIVGMFENLKFLELDGFLFILLILFEELLMLKKFLFLFFGVL